MEPFEPDIAGLRSVLTLVPDFVIAVDRDGIIRYVNRVEEGYDAAAVVGSPASAYVAPRSRQRFQDILTDVFREGREARYEIQGAARPGEEPRWYRSRIYPLFRDGVVVAAVIIAKDVTEARGAREACPRTEEGAETLRKLLPVCAWCGRIKDDRGYWREVEAYLRRATGVRVTHGICPRCEEKEFGPDGRQVKS